MKIELHNPLDVVSENALSRFSFDDVERDDLPPRVPVRIVAVESSDWEMFADGIVEGLRETYTGDDYDTWVAYSPQRGLSCGEIIWANLREFPEEDVVQVLDAVAETIKVTEARHQRFSVAYVRGNA